MHYFKRNIGDYHKKAGRLTMLQHGAYTLLMDSCYDREQFPTMEEAIDWCWASTPEEVDAVKFVLTKFFKLEDGRYTQSRVAEEIQAYHAVSETNKRIAQEREDRKKAEKARSVLPEARSVNEPNTPEHEPAPNHKPLTTNHKPLTNTSIDATHQLSADESAGLGFGVDDDFPEKLAPCPHKEILALWAKHLPHLAQPRTWEGTRPINLRARWAQASKKSDYSTEGYTTKEGGLKWWDSFFAYIANDTRLAGGFESKDRTWTPDLEWVIKQANFQKIVDGKYAK